MIPDDVTYLPAYANPGAFTQPGQKVYHPRNFCQVHNVRWATDEPCFVCQDEAS